MRDTEHGLSDVPFTTLAGELYKRLVNDEDWRKRAERAAAGDPLPGFMDALRRMADYPLLVRHEAISEEMISAGADELSEKEFGEDLREIATDVYIAMRASRPGADRHSTFRAGGGPYRIDYNRSRS